MKDSMLKNVKHTGAYIVGGALAILGVLGLVGELTEREPSPANYYGYGLAILLIASGAAICFAGWFQASHVGAYTAGGVLVFLGILGLLEEVSKAMPSSTNFYRFVLGVVLIAAGVVTFISARFHYGGGLWSFIGLICITETITHFTFVAQTYMQGRHLISPDIYLSETAAFWVVGCYCLVAGHMRHHRKKATPPNTARACVETPAR